jgi:hypothetical protein
MDVSLSAPDTSSSGEETIDPKKWYPLYTPTELILNYAIERSIPPSYVRIDPEDGTLTDLFYIINALMKACQKRSHRSR